jgi:hypothetical protein
MTSSNSRATGVVDGERTMRDRAQRLQDDDGQRNRGGDESDRDRDGRRGRDSSRS